ncbi:colanic acid biosynthesis glycosyltransferase WcaL [Exilibacterium tricleocarpae]|uniref:Colanic acid biosynthesis glycosyltransferase WcaL n=1 Tax=Exilibacterium tricleocarpae TaxID=2591008 RepID=A0A545SZY8_9GAMM|nr:glycosyltransferase [Exilibacterium tricleocarpae]TQV70535.1 colanic acid biosynthesis glycosyltransferase WcaL [Exilibacterium tricleocarpae]
MTTTQQPRVAYVLKVYPRFSETFILNEILAHQEVGEPVAIYSLRRSDDQRFHEGIAQVSSPVTYVPLTSGSKATALWNALRLARRAGLNLDTVLDSEEDIDSGDLEQALWLAASVRERGIEHLHAHFGTLATAVARLAAQLAGISYSFTAHAKDIFHQQVDRDVLRRKLADAATVVTVSEFNVRYLQDTFGPAAASLNLIYNGIDLEQFKFTAPASRRPLILGIGRLVEKKGFEYLIDACAELVAQGQQFTCEIAGPGILAAALQARIEARQLSGYVKLCGPLAQSEVRAKLLQASVMAAPCVISADDDRDGLPTILLEAMALGTPCVSTDVTGIPEVLRHNQTGLQVAQRDAQGLAAACGRLIHDSELRQRLARAARRLIEEKFDIRRNSAELRQVFSAAMMTSNPAVGQQLNSLKRTASCAE